MFNYGCMPQVTLLCLFFNIEYLRHCKNSVVTLKMLFVAAAIAPWFHLHLPSCAHRFESQAHYLSFFNLICNWRWNEKRTKKRPIFKNVFRHFRFAVSQTADSHIHKLMQRPLDYFGWRPNWHLKKASLQPPYIFNNKYHPTYIGVIFNVTLYKK